VSGSLEQRLGLTRLTARSVIASTLLGVSPPELPTRSLVGTAELLGIAPGTARVAMSRMVAAGELEQTDHGYRLVSPRLLARQDRQNRSRTGASGPWDGTWRMLVVTAEARPQADRAALRAALTARRFGELREGVWTRPDNLGPDQPAALEEGHGLVRLAVHPDEPEALAGRLWPLEGWAERAALLLVEVDRLEPRLAGGDAGALAEGFVVSAAVLRHFQADPLLPAELLPPTWPGPVLRERYDRYDAAFRSTLAAWQRAHRAN
jgi:phenylacetic acid degradation operon negative regulatory protein